ncbi:hypothetical protein WICPIJ_003588 [Wickerhamomyces pijperi]|uniref:Uncharacterized protein n=1 Tax=Wickerhamomyces pijperi TaxID=599730 RepID=A0A9P8TNQ7_WICPI|nr:hypothetical protein WICPIJ_003588 [Wickerhamomyces pijperi]
MSQFLKKTIFSGVLFTTGFVAFAKAWPANSIEHNQRKSQEQRQEIIEKLQLNTQFNILQQNKDFTSLTHSSKIPKAHQTNHVSQGLLFGPQQLEIDPIVFVNEKDQELKRGVTAKLTIDFKDRVKTDATVLLKAKVVESKGRKVVIAGHIETVDENPEVIATANCILVEPKWFKYFSWLSMF